MLGSRLGFLERWMSGRAAALAAAVKAHFRAQRDSYYGAPLWKFAPTALYKTFVKSEETIHIHPHILRLLTWFHDERRIYLVVEFAAGGELYNHLTKSPKGRFPENKAAKYIYQVADAVEYCHQHHVIHRDIKPENILVAFNGDLKLADFGWSVHAPSERRRTMCGTLDYLPPEMIRREVYNVSVDHWCIGVLLYEFLVGKSPFESEGQDKTYARILSLDIVYPEYVPEGAKDLISKLLKHTSKERLSLDGVKNHYWVQQNYNTSTNM